MEQACHGSMDNFIPVSSRTMSMIMGKLLSWLVITDKNNFFGIIVQIGQSQYQYQLYYS